MASSFPIAGRTLGPYLLMEQIGAGGMGVVYLARDERLDRDVAIKVLPPGALREDSARKRFRNEALAISKLNHANVATVYEFDSVDGIDFLPDFGSDKAPRRNKASRNTSSSLLTLATIL